MRRIGLLISALGCVGALVAGGVAGASPERVRPASSHGTPMVEPKFGPAQNGGSQRLEAPAKTPRNNSLNDRLIRPLHGLDASAGLLG
jgi:hypothetical protein